MFFCLNYCIDYYIDVRKEISKGDLLPGPGEDLLTMTIGPQHPCRTRAVGHDIDLTKGMQGLEKKRGKPVRKNLLVRCKCNYIKP
uniref:Uncharacterized protein n=1 Tax=Lactuca sativa TaxID=4236 RepID=A0A9R1V027_LACSA|nr:hypothetical protein LSAT_V11C700381020 [Lactuca sativa]